MLFCRMSEILFGFGIGSGFRSSVLMSENIELLVLMVRFSMRIEMSEWFGD